MPFSRIPQHDSVEDDSFASEPLLVADTGVIMEADSLRTRNKKKVSAHRLRSLIRLITLIGFLIGIFAPFLTVDIALLIAHWCKQLDLGVPSQKEVFVVLSVLWGLTVILLAIFAPCVPRRRIFRHFGVESVSKKFEEHVEVRLALGTLVGVLVSEFGMSYFIHSGVWTYVGLAIGCLVVIFYCISPFGRITVKYDEDLESAMQSAHGIMVV